MVLVTQWRDVINLPFKSISQASKNFKIEINEKGLNFDPKSFGFAGYAFKKI